MNACPCCSGKLLRHIRSTGVYWFCARCRQEMPCLGSFGVAQSANHLQSTADRVRALTIKPTHAQ